MAGHPALDLVNTIKFRGAADPQDKLTSYTNLLNWAQVSGLVSQAQVKRLDHPDDGPKLLNKAIKLRENLWRIFNRKRISKKSYLAAIKEMEAAISALRPKIFIDPDTGVLSRQVQVDQPSDLIACLVEAAAEVFATRAVLKIKTCDGCDCDWLFIDKTKAGRRRWCDTKTCGNLARVRAYREKAQKTEQNHAG